MTVVIDLTPIREKTGPARLLAMIEGCSKQAFKSWLAGRAEDWRDGISVTAMDGFSGFKPATAEEVPAATAVMDSFHVVRLAGEALDVCRRRVQRDIHGWRGHAGHPLYGPAGPCIRAAVSSRIGSATSSLACSRMSVTSRSKRPGVSISG